MSKRMFVSVPMAGRERREILQDIFDVTEAYRKKTGDDSVTEWVHNLDCDADPDDGPLWYLGNAIIKLGTCDGIVMCPGWKDTRGCRIEHQVACEYDIDIFDLSE